MEKPLYITTTIPYVNADPHVGFALEAVQADAVARHYRLEEREVFYNAGTDEHGQKIWEAAQEQGEDVEAYVDRYAQSVRTLKSVLNLSYDNFVRTTDEHHKQAAQELWRRCEEKGDIYKKKYKGLYCVGCEKFLSTRDLVDGKCPLHPNREPAWLEEENYFFKLSNYQAFLEEYLSRKDVIVPPHRLKEAQQFVAQGLEDFSISRDKEKLPWGVLVPGDETQTMYVWFDALANYISTLGWPEDKAGNYAQFWEGGEVMQMAGKDQVRFQSIMWPAMLRSAGLSAPKQIFYHGFITSDGQRMSKSLGNVISPTEMVERYGTDATRYILLRHVHPTEDTDVTWERMDEWYNANLANGLGNLVARVMTLAESYVEESTDWDTHGPPFTGYPKEQIKEFRFDLVMDYVWDKIAELDGEIQTNKPWETQDREFIRNLSLKLYRIGKLLDSFMPTVAERIVEATKTNKKPETLFPRIES